MRHSVRNLLAVSILLSVVFNYFLNGSALQNQAPESTRASLKDNLTARTEEETFSGCLLLMDDNHFLIEWLAYHYHVLKLTHLVVTVDPRGKSTPLPILERWQGRINITFWEKDQDYVKNRTEFEEAESWVSIKFKNDKPSPELVKHRARQRLFYFHCLQEHKRSGRRWTLLTDTDEFLLINYNTVAHRRPNEAPPEPISSPGSVLHFLQNDVANHPKSNVSSSPCIQIPRWRFGAVEDSVEYPPGPFKPKDFNTLRWLYHASPSNYKYNRISKTVVDVSRTDWQDLEPVESIHRPVRKYCGRRKLHIQSSDQFLIIHHYLGSWEQYNFRKDARKGMERSEQMYRKTAKLAEEYSQAIAPWLAGFVQANGIDAAKFLLADTGKTSGA